MNELQHLVINSEAEPAIGILSALVPGGWVGSFRIMAVGGSWADSFVAVPVWLLCVLWMMILTAVGAVLLVLMNRRRKLEVATPTLTKADILGLRWRWNYQDGVICDLQSYCPKCDRPVSPRSEKRHGYLQLISYQCECRKWRSKSFQCSQEQFYDQVCRAIQEKTSIPPAAINRGRCAPG